MKKLDSYYIKIGHTLLPSVNLPCTYFLVFQKVGSYTIPPGHQVCVSPTVNHKLTEVWNDAEVFKPDRSVRLRICMHTTDNHFTRLHHWATCNGTTCPP